MSSVKSIMMIIGIAALTLQATPPVNPQKASAGDLTFSGQWFLAWQSCTEPDSTFNQFALKQGYVTFQKIFNSRFSARITQDIAVDHEGDGMGNIEIRLKYGYLRYSFEKLLFLTRPFIEAGLVHRPWIDFEQKINRYRVQGPMYLERRSLLRSADYGVTFSALIGDILVDDSRQFISPHYPGKFGSLAVGIYNGGGYDMIENNNNKLIEGRLSLRPVPKRLPGFQCHYIGAYGKGNTTAAPDFSLNAFSLTIEQHNIVLVSTLISGCGDAFGILVDNRGHSLEQNGYSQFFELRSGRMGASLFGRYDRLRTYLSGNDRYCEIYIAGLACSLFEKARLVADVEYQKEQETSTKHQRTFEIAIEFLY
ncbi:MAG: hypothetical protein ACP5FZ_01670 [Fidelibacterota bacterium]